MISRILSSQLQHHVGEQVFVQGWLHTVRLVGSKLAFVIIRDRGGLMQIVLEDETNINMLSGCLTGSIVSAQGTVAAMSKGKFPYELQRATITIHRAISEPSPIDISKDELHADHETIHDHKVVALRHPHQMKVFSIVGLVEKYLRNFLDNHEFTQINTPKIIAFPTEGGAEVFEVKYFDRTCYLAQSPQFYKQMMVPVFEKVYEIGHAYRAEKSNTSRHMSEILMLDMEMGFIDDVEDILMVAERMITEVISRLRNDHNELMTVVGASRPLLASRIPRISVKELQELYYQHTGEDLRQELDIVPAQERFICEYSANNRGSDAVFVTQFPRSDAKFYHYQSRTNPAVADRADLLFRGVEISTLTRREVDHARLVQQIIDRGLDPHHPGLKHYLDAFKYGMPEEGGFGFGIARFAQKLIGLDNVKQAELFPRDTSRVTP